MVDNGVGERSIQGRRGKFQEPDQAVHALLEGVESQFKVSQCDG
jgi:hypothetical protein